MSRHHVDKMLVDYAYSLVAPRDTLRTAMVALEEYMRAIEAEGGSAIHDLFGTGGEGTLSYAQVSDSISRLRVEVGLDEPPLPTGWWTRALAAYKVSRANHEDPRMAGERFKHEEASR